VIHRKWPPRFRGGKSREETRPKEGTGLNAKARREGYSDGLTGLANRWFYAEVESALSTTSGSPFST
jgi:hypothetical protein